MRVSGAIDSDAVNVVHLHAAGKRHHIFLVQQACGNRAVRCFVNHRHITDRKVIVLVETELVDDEGPVVVDEARIRENRRRVQLGIITVVHRIHGSDLRPIGDIDKGTSRRNLPGSIRHRIRKLGHAGKAGVSREIIVTKTRIGDRSTGYNAQRIKR